MNAKKSFLFTMLRESKDKRNRLLLLEAARAALTIAAAWAGAHVIDSVFLAHKGLLETAPVLLVLFLLMAAIPLLSAARERAAQGLSTALRTRVREALHAQMLTSGAAGEAVRSRILSLALEETDALDLWTSRVLPVLLGIGVTMPIVLVTAAVADPLTGLLMLVTMPIAPFLLYLIGRVTQTASEEQWKRMEALSARFGELLRTLPALRLFHQAEAQRRDIETLSEDFSASALRVLQLSFLSAFALELITTLAIAIIAVGIGFRLLYGQMDFRAAFFVLLITPEFYQPLRQAGTAFHSAMTAWTAEQAIRAAISPKDEPHERMDSPKSEAVSSLEVRGLSFHYPKSREYLFRNLNFTLLQGKITVIKGPSGCGKSTLLRILAGLLPPSEGAVTIGGSPASGKWKNDASPISYVPQEPHLYNGTLAENVALFHAAGDEAICRALRQAALGEWLAVLPNGIQTLLGEGGQTLSQGQRKRLGIARALLQDRPIVLLDEPTAGLDAQTRESVRTALGALCMGRTVLIASHDEAICAKADALLQFDWEVTS